MLVRDLQRIRTKPGGTALLIGDVILDEYYECEGEYSFNEQTRSYRVKKILRFPGGAANVAANLAALGSEVLLLGVTGDDPAAGHLNELLGSRVTSILQTVPGETTCMKTRITTGGKDHTIKVEHRGSGRYEAEVCRLLLEQARSVWDQADIIVISDYGLGVAGQRLIEVIAGLARETGKPLLIDPRGWNADKYRGATILTPNLRELNVLVNQSSRTWKDAVPHARKLISEQGIDYIVLKDSGSGSVLIGHRDVLYCPVLTGGMAPVCTIGAGDSLIAAMAFGVMHGLDNASSFYLGNLAAACAVTKAYTSVVGLDEIIRLSQTQEICGMLQRMGEESSCQ